MLLLEIIEMRNTLNLRDIPVYELWEIVSHAMQAALQNITHQFLKT
jgi:hypothetical protein